MNKELIKDLPVFPYLDKICETLKSSPSRFLVLTAQTAAGKSTAVPLSLLEHFPGKILMLEPRRLAAVAIASRVAELLGEETGMTSGYTLHLEKKTSSRTRFEVITEAILTRRIQKDPSLEGINVVVLDEFHQRSVHADLSLAFLKEAMALRDDLFVIIMSATMDAQKTASYLSNPSAPVMEIPGRQFPVEITYDDKSSPAQAIKNLLNSTRNRENSPDLRKKSSDLDSNERSVVQYRNDTILCFLPGIYEINKTRNSLLELLGCKEQEKCEEIEILILHSSISLSQQKKVLSPVLLNQRRRVILSSAIAETSLTVPGVSVVIDSGFSRVNKTDLATGMEKLVTERISSFSADQRSGRAGRVMAGKAIRLWNKLEIIPKELSPEILRADLSGLVLECFLWGASSPSSLSWLCPPPASAWKTSVELLEGFGLIKNKKITQEGKAALQLGLSPRLSCLLIFGLKTGHLQEALNFILKFSEYKDSSSQIQENFLSNLKKRASTLDVKQFSPVEFSKAGLLLAGYPDRLAIKIETLPKEGTVYQFPSGRKALLQKEGLNSPLWIIAPEVNVSSAQGKIYSWEEISSADLEHWLLNHTVTEEKVFFEDKLSKLKKSLITRYGQIILKEIPQQVTQDDFGKALCQKIKDKGFDGIPVSQASINFLCRTIFFINNTSKKEKASLLEMKIQNLTEDSEKWLLPFITGNSISEETVFNSLYWWLDGDYINQIIPSVLVLENGKKVKIQYENRVSGNTLTIDSLLTNVRSLAFEPVVEVIIQQVFGCFTNPKISGVPVLFKLLSPARRPLQITNDLSNFWEGAWIEICREMKGRYPKHNWDYRIS